MRKHVGKIVAIGLAAALAVFALAGCGGSSNGSASASADASASGSAAATTAQAELLKFGCQNYSAGGLDPAVETNTAWNSMRYGITECLFKFDDAMEVQGWLAEDDYTVSDDHKTWTFNIKKDIKFSNGTELTPSAVAAAKAQAAAATVAAAVAAL